MNNSTNAIPSDHPEEFIVLGTIVRPHGLKGELKVSLACSGINRLLECNSLRLTKNGKELKRVSLIRAFLRPDGDAVIRLKEITGVDEAEQLRGCCLSVLLKDRAEAPEGHFFIDDLYGMKAITSTGMDLGIVAEVLDGKANAICIVRRGSTERLIPFVKSTIRKVDLKTKTIIVDLPEEIDAETEY